MNGYVAFFSMLIPTALTINSARINQTKRAFGFRLLQSQYVFTGKNWKKLKIGK